LFKGVEEAPPKPFFWETGTTKKLRQAAVAIAAAPASAAVDLSISFRSELSI
jgi:hypothetical protein